MEVIGYPNYLIFPNGEIVGARGKILKTHIGKHGYLHVRLYNEDDRKSHYIHRLVAIHYIPNHENKPHVDHIDRNPLNNDISNLRWATSSENQQNTIMQKNNKCGIKNISYLKRDNIWKYEKIINGNKFLFTNKNKNIVLWCKFAHYLLTN